MSCVISSAWKLSFDHAGQCCFQIAGQRCCVGDCHGADVSAVSRDGEVLSFGVDISVGKVDPDGGLVACDSGLFFCG